MMADPARVIRRERFWLSLSPAGAWSWSWEAVGKATEASSTAAWQQSVTVAYAGRPCTILLLSGAPSAPPPPPFKTGFTPSLLKSALQKSVRRGRSAAAAAASLALWRVDPVDLVRRVLIIAVEDVCAHPASPALAWLVMALAKGFTPGEPHLRLVLGVVRDLCECPWKDTMRDAGGRGAAFAGSDAEAAVAALLLRRGRGGAAAEWTDGGAASSPHALGSAAAAGAVSSPAAAVISPSAAAAAAPADADPPPNRPTPESLDALDCPGGASVVRALLVRASYGGMAHDVAMLRRAAGLWARRLSSGEGGGLRWLQAVALLQSAGRVDGDAFFAHPPPPLPSPAWCAYSRAVTPTDLARVPAAHSLRAVVTAVEDGCSDLSESILRGGGPEVQEWAARVSARLAPSPGHPLGAAALLEVLQGQVWRCRSGLNARSASHVLLATALREALVERPRPARGAAAPSAASAASSGAGAAELACAGSWAELDPVHNPLAAATIAQAAAGAARPRSFVRASDVATQGAPDLTGVERAEVAEFACVAAVIEAWSAAHLGRRS